MELEVKLHILKQENYTRNSRAEAACTAMKNYLRNLLVWIKEGELAKEEK